MGQYRNGGYYRGKNDADLQWLEDGANLVIALFVHGMLALILGIFQLCVGVFELITAEKPR
jgi:hypothetical protein